MKREEFSTLTVNLRWDRSEVDSEFRAILVKVLLGY